MHFGEMFYGQTNIELFDHNDKRYIFGGVQLRLLNLRFQACLQWHHALGMFCWYFAKP